MAVHRFVHDAYPALLQCGATGIKGLCMGSVPPTHQNTLQQCKKPAKRWLLKAVNPDQGSWVAA